MLITKSLIVKLLPKFININDARFIEACNAVGMEVEQIIEHPYTPDLVVGRLVEVKKHPNADTLNICQVLVNNKTTEIICSADQLSPNHNVIVAREGVKMINDMVIANRDMRGVTSHGMMCAYHELTPHNQAVISEWDKNQIIFLDDAKIDDNNPLKHLGLEDKVYDVAIPSNRNELNGLIEFANEIAIHFGWEFNLPRDFDFKISKSNSFKVNLKSDDVNAYSIVKLDQINYQDTPWVLKGELMNCNIKPQDNVVDLANYVTLLTANPLHFFDQAKVVGNITVKNATKDEIMVGLDNHQYQIKTDDLIICDNQKTIALAGVIGAANTMVDASTKAIYAEVANFKPRRIAATVERLKLNTTAGVRFSKPLSLWVTKLAINQLLETMQPYVKSIKVLNDIKIPQMKPISVSINELNNFLGIKKHLASLKHKSKLLHLDFNTTSATAHPMRLDIINAQDVYEEIMKLEDVNKLIVQPITANVIINNNYQRYNDLKTIRNFLVDYGCYETKTYNLTSKANNDLFNFFKLDSSFQVINAISKQREYLRTNLFTSLLDVLKYNRARKRPLHNIFEMQQLSDKTQSFKNLTILLSVPLYQSPLNQTNVPLDLMTAKALTTSLLAKFNVKYNYRTFKTCPNYYPENALIIVNDKKETIGYVGQIRRTQLKKYDLETPVFGITLNLDLLFAGAKKEAIQYQKIANVSAISRDVNITLKRETKIIKVLNELQLLPNIEDVVVKDSYANVDDITYTISYNIQSYQKTFNVNEIDNYSSKVAKIIKNYSE